MILFNGLREILLCAIENTEYISNDVTQKKREKSDEERLHDALKALFGDSYPIEFIPAPHEVTPAQMIWLHKQILKGEKLGTSINKLVGRILNPEIPKYAKRKEPTEKTKLEYKDKFKHLHDRIKKHYQRHKEEYRQAYGTKHEASSEILDWHDIENEKAMILQSLRIHGWPI